MDDAGASRLALSQKNIFGKSKKRKETEGESNSKDLIDVMRSSTAPNIKSTWEILTNIDRKQGDLGEWAYEMFKIGGVGQ